MYRLVHVKTKTTSIGNTYRLCTLDGRYLHYICCLFVVPCSSFCFILAAVLGDVFASIL